MGKSVVVDCWTLVQKERPPAPAPDASVLCPMGSVSHQLGLAFRILYE